MSNSRTKFAKADDKPTNTSKGKGLILETPYKPGFIEDKDLETVKMAVDKELSEISNAFYQTIEKTADTITRVDKLEIAGDTQFGELVAKIEEVDKVSKEGDVALASRITTISAEVGDNKSSIITESEARAEADRVITTRVDTILGAMEGDLGPLVGQIQTDLRVLADNDSVLSTRIDTVSAEYKTADADIKASVKTEEIARVDGDSALASSINTVKTELGSNIASVQQYATTEINKTNGKVDAQGNTINSINAKWGVSVNVNDKITGIQLNNDGKSSTFSVQADRFTISDGTSDTIPPFEIVGGNTRIKSAFVHSLQSDTWDGVNNGWAITRDGYAKFNNVHVRGTIDATNGTFDNVVIRNSCVYQGQINSTQINDTAVTAANKVSGTGPGTGPSSNTTLSSTILSGNVVHARPYDRVLYITYPGIITATVEGGSTASRDARISVDLVYNGIVISTILVKAWRAGQGAGLDFPAAIGGIIPANSSGSYSFRVHNFAQDRTPTINYTSQVCLVAIYKTSNEIN